MEKNTLIAIGLSVAVLMGFYFVQQKFFPPQPRQQQVVQAPPAPPPAQAAAVPQHNQVPQPAAEPGADRDSAEDMGPVEEQRIVIETELLRVILSNAGGDVVSWKLKGHKDKDSLVEMVLPGETESHAFTIALGGLNAQPLSDLFYVEQESEYSVKFYRDFSIANNESARFRLTKKYEFRPQDYMFELTVSLDGGHSVPGFNFGGSAYTLSFGPQIGPRFEKLDKRYEYRQYITFAGGKRKMEKPGDYTIISTSPKWAAISGKYFASIAIPLLPSYELNFSEKPEPGILSASRLNIIRPAITSARADDMYRFYVGPKNQDMLHAYNTGKNGFDLFDMQLVEVANTRGILSPLESALKWLLLAFYNWIPNYGVAIILLTLTVKIFFFPLTKKSSEATLRMQALAPKIKELQDKYKDNKQKLNTEMSEFYKKEGYNPLAGCLPMLLQIPIFFAMYNLFNNHFDLRGAMFISGWIPDLSLPEHIWVFPGSFRLPLLGWSALRLLPFIYVGSQLLYGKVTQTPDQQSNAQTKMMLYVMPIMFFFILYDVPSGLLIYWIFSNLLTLVQQVGIVKYLLPRQQARAEAQAAAKPAAAASPKKKKK